MSLFQQRYTTSEKKTADALKKPEEQTEKGKNELSNDAFAIGEMIGELILKIHQLKNSISSIR